MSKKAKARADLVMRRGAGTVGAAGTRIGSGAAEGAGVGAPSSGTTRSEEEAAAEATPCCISRGFSSQSL